MLRAGKPLWSRSRAIGFRLIQAIADSYFICSIVVALGDAVVEFVDLRPESGHQRFDWSNVKGVEGSQLFPGLKITHTDSLLHHRIQGITPP